jgi:sortase A
MLLLAFVAYQIYGTAIYEHHAQALLVSEFKRHLGAPVAKFPRAVAAPKTPPTTTATEAPVSHVAPSLADPPVGTAIGLMSIPRIGMTGDAIVEGTDEHQLQQGPGHYQGTPLPGEAGNVAIAGHRTTYAAPFYNLDALQAGDLIYIQTAQGIFDYAVTSQQVVSPNDTQVLAATTTPTLTLTTCNPRYSASSRLVVTALLRTAITADSFPAGSQPRSSEHEATPHQLAGEGGLPTSVSTLGEALRGAAWGAAAVLVLALAVVGWRRMGRSWRWVALGAGIPVALVLLLICFGHVSLALPETF